MKNHFVSKFATILLFLFVLIFAGYQGVRYLKTDYKTQTVYQYSAPRFYDVQGLLIRDEELLPVSCDGVVRYLMREGQFFGKSSVIARVYDSQEQADRAIETERAQKEQEVLQKVYTAHFYGGRADLNETNDKILSALQNYQQSMALQDYSDPEKIRLSLIEQFGRRLLITEGSNVLDERISLLEQAASYTDSGTAVRVSSYGYFSRYVDGFESVFTLDFLDQLTPNVLSRWLKQEYVYDAESFGKRIKSENWYFAAMIPAEDASNFRIGNTVTMTFQDGVDDSVTGVVNELRETDSDELLIIIKSDQINEFVVSARTANVRISFSDYSGLQFPKQALRIVDGIKGVYVKSTYKVVFKEVDIIYTGRDYYLSAMSDSDDTKLSLFDEVIVSGDDLYDGKLLDFG